MTYWRARKFGRLRWALCAFQAVLLCACASWALAAAPALAGTTAISSFTKTGTDPATGSTAVAGGPAGSTKAGDTINWVLSYTNKTSSAPSVSISDTVGANQSYVAGSLKAPPGFTTSTPTSGGATTVQATGGVQPASTAGGSAAFTPLVFNTPGGDGYSVEGAGNNIYTVFHHSASATTVFCTTLGNAVCPGWPGRSTYVNVTAGTHIGTGGVSPYTTAYRNGSFIDSGNLYWPVEARNATAGAYQIGIMCLNLTTLDSCGLTSLGTVPSAPGTSTTYANLASDGVAASNGHYYVIEQNGNMVCFAPSPTGGTTCGSANVSGGRTLNANGVGEIKTVGRYVFTVFSDTAGTEYASCFDTVTAAVCPGFPISTGAAPALVGMPAPVLSTTGAVTGFCDSYYHKCYSLSGATVTDPYVGTSLNYTNGSGFGQGDVIGAKFYAHQGAQILCFDFAQWTGIGVVPRCAGFAGPSNPNNYTVTGPLANLPGCLAANGDAGVIALFSETTGQSCGIESAKVSTTPSQSYCDGGSGHVTGWDKVSLVGLTGAEYTGATVTLTNAAGAPIAGWSDVPIPAGQTSLDISSLPIAQYPTLSAAVTISGVTDASVVQAAHVALSWKGDPIQVCFKTTVGPSSCNAPPLLANTATAVTNGGVGATDAPTGNGSGTVRFEEAADTSQCAPSVSIQKIADAADGNQTPISVGEQIHYSYLVTNTGNVDLPTLSVDDPTGGTVTCPVPPAPGLAPDASLTCTADKAYTVTQDDVDAGQATDTATAGCVDKYGDACAPSAPSTANVPASAAPGVEIAKHATVTPAADQLAAQVGDSIQYTYTVTNSGNVTLATVSVSDPDLGTVVCPTPPAPGLAPGASLTCTAVNTHTVSQADVDAGQVVDSATAAGVDRKGNATPPSNRSTAVVPTVAPAPDLALQKIAHADGGDQAPITLGEQIHYSYYVVNTGNVTLTDVQVSDPTGGSVTCPPGALAPSASVTCTADAVYTVTQADVNNGSVTDVATATGTPPTPPSGPPTPPPTSPPSSVTVPGDPSPLVGILKVADVSPAADQDELQVGDTIAYSYVVTNIGNVDLTSVAVDDPTLGTVTCPQPAAPGLAPGASETCTADSLHTVTQADVDAGTVTDVATASGRDGLGQDSPPSNRSTVTLPTVPAAPLTSIVKTAQVTPGADQEDAHPGDTIAYSFLVTNTGNVDLTTVQVADPAIGAVSCPDPAAPGLAPGDSLTCTSTQAHTVSDEDVTAGHVDNVATATGTDTRGQTSAESAPSHASVPTSPRPLPPVASPSPVPPAASIALAPAKISAKGKLVLRKTASVRTLKAGGRVTYRLKVSNPTAFAVTKVKVCDALPRGLVFVGSSPKAKLTKGQRCWSLGTLRAHGSRTITLRARTLPGAHGKLTNHAVATGSGVAAARAQRAIKVVARRAHRPTPVTG